MTGTCELGRALCRREINATEAGAGRFEKTAPDARAAPPEAHEWLISPKTVADVPLTGLSFWQGAGVPFFTDRYAVRSYYLTGFGMISAGDWTKDERNRTDTIRGYTEARRISPLLLGDYYPLTPYSLDKTSWIAWKFHRTDLNEGVVQAFRRPEAPGESLTVRLRGLDPRDRYELENLDGSKEVRTGAELMGGHAVTLREKPAAAVLVLNAIK